MQEGLTVVDKDRKWMCHADPQGAFNGVKMLNVPDFVDIKCDKFISTEPKKPEPKRPEPVIVEKEEEAPL
jgi:hypothetical protein